ncbi:MAG: ATP-binding cassette domain-containing protein [Heliobacteriaceae bacterium]|nr:ATP-binding cassette domain-containing protein [Heliobacteriaceae bacterium]MDD4588192.1 ATP-binding cassette domain-containing protein [Heliobacteriaceae bacterium]
MANGTDGKVQERRWAWLSYGLVLGLWKLGSLAVNPLVLPSPEVVLACLFRLVVTPGTWELVAGTAYRALTGLVTAVGIGVLAGLVFFPLTRHIRPVVTVLQNIPVVSWILLGIIWFGFTDANVTFVVFVATLPVIYLNTVEGVAETDRDLLTMARSFRLPPLLQWYGLKLPSLGAFLTAGVSVAIAIMWKSVVMAELLTARPGIGTELGLSRTYLLTDQLLAWTLLLVVLGLTTERFWRWLVYGGMVLKVYRLGLQWLPLISRSRVPRMAGETAGTLRLVQVTKGYRQQGSDHQVLAGVTLELRPGDRVALVGPSGVGKTTLLGIMAGLTVPDQGRVDRGNRLPGLMFQEPRLLPWFTAEENIIFVLLPWLGYREARPLAQELLAKLQIPVAYFPSQLSGGMKQAVALARALSSGGNLLLLDEPFRSSDPEQRCRMIDALTTVSRAGDILVIVTHQLDEIRNLVNKTFVLDGRPARLTVTDGP